MTHCRSAAKSRLAKTTGRTRLIAGGLVGSQLGARACVIFSQARLRLIFNALLVSATLYMGGAGLGLITAVSSKG